MYPKITGGSLGQLLRAIQESREQSPAAIPQASEVGSPIRAMGTPPTVGVESPGSERVISVKPEGNIAPGSETISPDGAAMMPRGPLAPGFAGEGGV